MIKSLYMYCLIYRIWHFGMKGTEAARYQGNAIVYLNNKEI